MNKRQKLQVVIVVIALILIIVWLLFFPGWDYGKILGIASNALVALSMILSYITEEKNKKKTD